MAPNEQRLEVGPIEVLFSVDAAEFLARFLHSNTTRSLHCLWQFIPQSVEETPWSGSLSLLWSQNHIYAVFLCHTCLSHLLGLGYPTFLMNLAFSHGQTPDFSLVALFKWKWHLGDVVSWLSHAWCLLLGDSLGLPAVRPYCFSLRVKGFFLFLTFSSHKGSQ